LTLTLSASLIEPASARNFGSTGISAHRGSGLVAVRGSKRSSPSIGDAIGSSINSGSSDSSANYKKQVGTADINNPNTVAINPMKKRDANRPACRVC
jgi:hypothetical protein